MGNKNLNDIKVHLNYVVFLYSGIPYCKTIYSFITLLIMLLILGKKSINKFFLHSKYTHAVVVGHWASQLVFKLTLKAQAFPFC